jgi:hypothetical protein
VHASIFRVEEEKPGKQNARFLSYHEDEDSVFLRNVCKLPEGYNVHKSIMSVFMEQAFRLKAMIAMVRWEGLKVVTPNFCNFYCSRMTPCIYRVSSK